MRMAASRRKMSKEKSVYSPVGYVRRLPQNELTFYCECRHALKVLFRIPVGLFDIRLLSRKASYRMLVGPFRIWSRCSVWHACVEMSPYEASLMIWKSFVADCCFAGMHPVRWNGGVYWAWFFLCPVIQPQYELIEGYVVRMLHGQFFVLDISSVCSNVSSLSDKRMHYTSVLASHNANDGMNDEAGWSLQSIASLFPL